MHTVQSAEWSNPPVLVGARVRLEPLQAAHAEALGAAACDGELWRLWYTSVPHPDGVSRYVDEALAEQAAGRALVFVVRDGDGTVVGSTRFYEVDPATPRVSIGYTWYAARVQRTGLNTETKRLLLEHAFERLRCIAVGFETSWFNHASRAAIARLGAKQDGVIRSHFRHADGSVRDSVVFSILDSEWPTVKKHLDTRLEARA